jgi:hypothetical protein
MRHAISVAIDGDGTRNTLGPRVGTKGGSHRPRRGNESQNNYDKKHRIEIALY